METSKLMSQYSVLQLLSGKKCFLKKSIKENQTCLIRGLQIFLAIYGPRFMKELLNSAATCLYVKILFLLTIT